MLLYALTIFLGAFLLFQIQPIIAKIILPWFGGGSAVWSACMLFFQVALLLGYLYTHFVVRRLRPKVQTILHVTLLGLSFLLLRVIPSPAWKPSGGQDPVFRIVGLLAASVGLPYFLLAATGPLMQAWYARAFRVAFPYRLFAVSNLGCLLALLSYPVLEEPYVATSNQAWIWSLAYAGFCLLCGACAWLSRRHSAPEPGGAILDAPPEAEAPPSWALYLLWIGLAACSSTFLLAVTNYVTENVAPVPFLWILPLSLYLLSFVLTFEREAWYRPNAYTGLLALALSGMCYGVSKFDGGTELKYVIPVFAGGLFVCCMFCHGELARLRPHARYLTGFYLTISFGGALGGVFVGGLAPRIFRGFFELPVAIVFCALLGLVVFRRLHKFVYAGWALLTIVLAGTLWVQERRVVKEARLMVRNFYGVLRVTQDGDSGDAGASRTLVHGTITHGLQFLAPDRRRLPTTYYGRQSGVGVAIQNTRRSAQRVGVIGLGAATLASYGRPGDYYRFYEINPLVIDVARREFTYLADCPAKVEVVLGDARLSLERELSQQLDVLAVDAFSSDSIPVHLLTLEAFRLYFRHLRPDGVLAVHISNTHLNLEPVVERLARALRKEALLVDTDNDADEVYGATWVLLASQPEVFQKPAFKGVGGKLTPRRGLRAWTDDYSNLFQILQ
jgi:SAM-dependent methyltransferase